MKISKLELLTIFLAAVFLAFTAGWFLSSSHRAEGVRVETDRILQQSEVIVLPTDVPGEDEALAPGTKININTADAELLQKLPGIGTKRAQDIIAYRTQHGPFRIPEDLTRIDGIGESTLQGLIDLITVEEETP